MSGLSESQVFEDISALIRLFKMILHSSDTLLNKPSASFIAYVQTLLAQCIGIIRQYQDYTVERSVMHRFACRLLETLAQYKGRYANQSFIDCLQNVEEAINQQHIGRIFTALHRGFINMCQLPIEKNPNEGEKELAIGIGTGTKTGPKNEDGNKTGNETSATKSIAEVQRRFQGLKCLDMQFPSFKSCFFEARSNQEQMYEACLARNSVASNDIRNYSLLFVRKKKARKSLNEANEFPNIRCGGKIKEMKEMKLKIEPDAKQRFSVNSIGSLRSMKEVMGQVRTEGNSELYNFSASVESKHKLSYKLRNVVLSLNNDQGAVTKDQGVVTESSEFIVLAPLDPPANPFRFYKLELQNKLKNISVRNNLTTRRKIDSLRAQIQDKFASPVMAVKPKEQPSKLQRLLKGIEGKCSIRKLTKLYGSVKDQ